MKIIEDIRVKVTFTVGVGNVEATNAVAKKLKSMHENGDTLEMSDIDRTGTREWLLDNIKEDDAMTWEAEIEDLTIAK